MPNFVELLIEIDGHASGTLVSVRPEKRVWQCRNYLTLRTSKEDVSFPFSLFWLWLGHNGWRISSGDRLDFELAGREFAAQSGRNF